MRAKEIVEAEAGSARAFLKSLGRSSSDGSRSDDFVWDDFNPDGMSEAELNRWIRFIGPGLRPLRAANKWFPGQPDRLKSTRRVRGYCWNKATAMDLRIQGNIEAALTYEALCDRIYNELPGYAKW